MRIKREYGFFLIPIAILISASSGRNPQSPPQQLEIATGVWEGMELRYIKGRVVQLSFCKSLPAVQPLRIS